MIRDVHDSSRRRKKKAMRSRAWLNGVEVTRRCFYADDRRGVVRLFMLNADGRPYIEDRRTGRAAKEYLRGRVRLERAS